MDVFISHSSLEAALAISLRDWIQRKVANARAFCSSISEDLAPGGNWFQEIVGHARTADRCLILVSPESRDKHWLYFEAGLTRGASELHKLVPILYGGLKPDALPGPLQHRQAMIIDCADSFNAFVNQTLEARGGVGWYGDFKASLLPAVERLITYGLYGGFFGECVIESGNNRDLQAHAHAECSFTVPRVSQGGVHHIVALRVTAVPRRLGALEHWKFGLQLRQSSKAGVGGRIFEFHSGMHDGRSSWSIYDAPNHSVPFNFPAQLSREREHHMELWLSSDLHFVTCVGIDSYGARVCFRNEHGETRWRLTDYDWDELLIKAWGDQAEVRVDLSRVEIHRTSVPIHGASVAEKPGGLQKRIWNVPEILTKDFTGRMDLIERLREKLVHSGATALTEAPDRVAALALHGLGGIGKTQTALRYAAKYGSNYDVVWWVAAEEEASLASALCALGRELGCLRQDDPDSAEAGQRVVKWLQSRRDIRWLLVFDNVPDHDAINGLLPRSNTGHVLITSRHHRWAFHGISEEPVPLMTAHEAADFVCSVTRSIDRVSAYELASELGYLPLALEQAAAYIAYMGLTIDDYRHIYKEETTLLATLDKGFRYRRSEGYPSSVGTTWAMSVKALEKACPSATDLLKIIAFLASEDIPVALFQHRPGVLPRGLAQVSQSPLSLDEVLDNLKGYSLIKIRSDGGRSLYVHRLVQLVTRTNLDLNHAEEKWFGISAELVDAFLPAGTTSPFRNSFQQLIGRSMELAKHAQRLKLAKDSIIGILAKMADFKAGSSELDDSSYFVDLGLRIAAEGTCWPPIETVVKLALNKAKNLSRGKKWEQAERLLEELLKWPADPTLAETWLDRIRGKRQESQKGHREYGKLSWQTHEVANTISGFCRNELGLLAEIRGNHVEAQRQYAETMKLSQDDESYDGRRFLCYALTNLGRLSLRVKDYDEAENRHRRALRIRTRMKPANFAEIGTTYMNLAEIAYRRGEHHKGRRLYNASLTMFAKGLSGIEKHPQWVVPFLGLACVEAGGGKVDQALVHFHEAKTRLGKVEFDFRYFPPLLAELGDLFLEAERILESLWCYKAISESGAPSGLPELERASVGIERISEQEVWSR